MSDEEFNPCECMWSYLSIQHLLSIVSRSDKHINAITLKRIGDREIPRTSISLSNQITCNAISSLFR